MSAAKAQHRPNAFNVSRSHTLSLLLLLSETETLWVVPDDFELHTRTNKPARPVSEKRERERERERERAEQTQQHHTHHHLTIVLSVSCFCRLVGEDFG